MQIDSSRAFFATAFFVACTVAAYAAEPVPPLAAPPGPEAAREKCRQDPAQCRKHGRARFEERFRKLDADGDGAMSRAEAEKGAPRMAERFAKIDANKDGKLTPGEIHDAARARMEQCKQDPEKCRAEMTQRFEADWKKADADGDGALSKAEAEKAIPRLAQRFDRIDADQDGKITLTEMEAARSRHHPRRFPKPDAAPSAAPKVNG